MNRRAWFWVCGVAVGLVILTKTPLVFTVFAFLVLGMIPGTMLTIPAWVLLTVYPLVFIGTVYWLSTQPLLIGAPAPAPTPAKKPVRARAKKAAVIKPTPRKRPARAAS